MGQVADHLADRVTVTSDNPRGEDPAAIIAAITAPMAVRSGVDTEPDRARAIERAIAEAQPGDVVLIAGKGHETEQIIGDQRISFDDREVAARAIEAARGGIR